MNTPEEELRLPDHLLTSVKRSRFHVIENRDISDEDNLQQLLLLIFNFPERSFYLFLQKQASLTEPLRRSVEGGDILVTQTDLEFFRHPKFPSDFVRIRRGSESFDWERQISSSEVEYLRFTLVLSERKRREMNIDLHLTVQSRSSANPLKLEPNLWGIGIDLRKAWAWFKSRVGGR